eukprot:scaffold81866_cov39-Tisochrysis_lutea.AAC.1
MRRYEGQKSSLRIQSLGRSAQCCVVSRCAVRTELPSRQPPTASAAASEVVCLAPFVWYIGIGIGIVVWYHLPLHLLTWLGRGCRPSGGPQRTSKTKLLRAHGDALEGERPGRG